MTHTQGDIIMGFGNPITSTIPLGQVRLHSFISDTEKLELWLVEYLDQPEHLYELWLPKKKTDGTNNPTIKENTNQ